MRMLFYLLKLPRLTNLEVFKLPLLILILIQLNNY